MTGAGASPVASLDQVLSQHVTTILNTAWACPPGGNRGWDALLAHYGVTPDPPVERVTFARDLRMQRGAIPSEVGRALEAVARWAHGQLVAMASSPLVTGDPGFAALGARIQGLVWHEKKRYEDAVVPPSQPTVGSIFSNASSTAAETPWANVRIEPANVLVCWSCGAPQEKQMSFVCRYCSQPLGGPPKSP
jgi:hypothetical protein